MVDTRSSRTAGRRQNWIDSKRCGMVVLPPLYMVVLNHGAILAMLCYMLFNAKHLACDFIAAVIRSMLSLRRLQIYHSPAQT